MDNWIVNPANPLSPSSVYNLNSERGDILAWPAPPIWWWFIFGGLVGWLLLDLITDYWKNHR